MFSPQIAARGGKLNTAFLSSFDPTILTPSGSVKVLPTLQVTPVRFCVSFTHPVPAHTHSNTPSHAQVPLANGKSNVFALGDIIEWQEQKTISKVPTQAGVVVPNILAAVKGTPMKQEYRGFMGIRRSSRNGI